MGSGSLLAGCSGQSKSVLTLRLLSGSIPPQILGEFQKAMGASLGNVQLNVAPEVQLQTLFTLLQTWKRQGPPPAQSGWQWPGWVPFVGDRGPAQPDLVTLGHYWLPPAIQQGLIQPLNPNAWPTWKTLATHPQWPALVTRDAQGRPDPQGQVWGAPYRWGSTVIAYRRDIFQEKGLPLPTDWADLWREDLTRRISLLDQPREVIGLTLKKLGQSYNTPDLTRLAQLEPELRRLHQQAKLYSSDAYLQPLLLGDTWAAVGWSTDILPLMQRNSNLAAVVPLSGTALWADLWVRPSQVTTTDMPVLNEWINFCWQDKIAERLSLLSQATSPVIADLAPDQLSPELRNNRLLRPAADTLHNSEFLLPLPESTVQQYQTLWTKLRTGQTPS